MGKSPIEEHKRRAKISRAQPSSLVTSLQAIPKETFGLSTLLWEGG